MLDVLIYMLVISSYYICFMDSFQCNALGQNINAQTFQLKFIASHVATQYDYMEYVTSYDC